MVSNYQLFHTGSWFEPQTLEVEDECVTHYPDSILTLAANVGTTTLWLAEGTLLQCWQATGKNYIQCIASANQIAAWCYVVFV